MCATENKEGEICTATLSSEVYTLGVYRGLKGGLGGLLLLLRGGGSLGERGRHAFGERLRERLWFFKTAEPSIF